jgi:NADH-quinone oxidoreductase subunit J
MELAVFIITAAIALTGAVAMLLSKNAVHSALFLLLNFGAIAVLYLLLRAPFLFAVQLIIYAGAIIVLFLFAVMLLNLGPQSVEKERRRNEPKRWIGPSALALVLAGELVWVFLRGTGATAPGAGVGPKQVGIALFGPYVLAVEIASMLLLAGLVGAYHLGRPQSTSRREGR